MNENDQALYELHAEVCKTLANPWRLRIMDVLGDGELTVTDLVQILGVPKANVSQHLQVMKDQGVVLVRRDGQHCHYRLASPKITQACRLMREVMLERMESMGGLLPLIRSQLRG